MVRSGDALINNSVVVNKAIAEVKVLQAPTAATYACMPDETRVNEKGNPSPITNDYQICSPQ